LSRPTLERSWTKGDIMRALRQGLAAALVVGAALLGTAGSATAAATSQHGVFTGVRYGSNAALTPASGPWSVTWRGDKVTATFNIFVDGAHHLAYGLPPQSITTGAVGSSFSFMTAASTNPLVVTVTGDQLTYRIAPYDFGGVHYDVVTYFGTVS
jgi:hypothetical protein